MIPKTAEQFAKDYPNIFTSRIVNGIYYYLGDVRPISRLTRAYNRLLVRRGGPRLSTRAMKADWLLYLIKFYKYQDAIIYTERNIDAWGEHARELITDLKRTADAALLASDYSIDAIRERLKIDNIINTKSKKIKVRIIHAVPHLFNSIETICEYMPKCPNIDIKLLSGLKKTGFSKNIYDISKLQLQADRFGITCEQFDEYDIGQDRPDIIIFNAANNPQLYIELGGFDKINNTAGYIAVVPFELFKFRSGYDKVLDNLSFDSLMVSKSLYNELSARYDNVVSATNPKFDIIYRQLRSPIIPKAWEKLKVKIIILWTTAHNCCSDVSSIDLYFANVLDYFEKHQDIGLIFRPHPLLIDEIVIRYKICSRSDLIEIKNIFSESRNMIWDDSEDYSPAFSISDALITDAYTGIIYSYLPTKKPIVLIYRNQQLAFELDEALCKNYYKAYSWLELKSILEMLAGGGDPLYADRMKTLEEYIPDFDGKCGERIGAFIIDDYLRKVGGRTQ